MNGLIILWALILLAVVKLGAEKAFAYSIAILLVAGTAAEIWPIIRRLL